MPSSLILVSFNETTENHINQKKHEPQKTRFLVGLVGLLIWFG